MPEVTDTNTVQGLVQTLENGHRGFGEAADKLARNGRDDLAAELRELSRQRGKMASELRDVSGSDESTNRVGSIPGALHRSWMALRDALTGNDPHAVLAAAEDGEDHAVDEYRKAVASDLAGPVRQVVERQASSIKTAHDKIRALRNSNR